MVAETSPFRSLTVVCASDNASSVVARDLGDSRDPSPGGFADPVVGEGRVPDGGLYFGHVAGCTVHGADGAGRAWVIVGCLCTWLIHVTLQTA
jgi:hypothetical protein